EEFWKEKSDKDITQFKQELNELKDKKEKNLSKLSELSLLYKEYEAVVLSDRIEKEKARQREEQEELELFAACKIQNWWRTVCVQHNLGPYGKKKRKGTKTKKGKGKKNSMADISKSLDDNVVISRRTLNTFGGVFCSVTLSQFSSVIFLRLVMLSRTLGPEFGGAIGSIFFLAQVCSAALYIAGLVEAVLINFGPGGILFDGVLPGENHWWSYLYAIVILALCTSILLIGSQMFARALYFILAVVVIVIICVFASFFLQPKLIPLPRSNSLIYNLSTPNNVTIFAEFTGLNGNTFKENIYRKFIFFRY
ncbi:unnamed protein product, partial [Schistosoma margrebowiei]